MAGHRTPRIRLSNESETVRHVRCRSEERERVIDDDSDIVPVASVAIKMHVGVAHPDPYATQGSLLNAIIERNIPLVPPLSVFKSVVPRPSTPVNP